MHNKHLKLLFLFVSAWLLGACSMTPTYQVGIDAINRPTDLGEGATYQLVSAMERVSSDSLQFQEFSDYVIKALATKGYQLTPSSEAADFSVALDYGVSDPQTEQYRQSVPVYGHTGYHAVTETTQVAAKDGGTQVVRTIRHVPSYGVRGFRDELRTMTTYRSHIRLTAKSLDQAASQLWDITITLTDGEQDLRRLFPIMLAAAQDYIGGNTGQKVYVELKADNARVEQLTSEAPSKP
ncbi:hypothetical protein [Marinomonas ostreistagni]|uniref:hypothetical protein n=1 Tax=Marinomonas ostreistagni TaxID=359209 RepID=UPI001951DEB4|nr:hypothetical protein [Marinomonas ostreistagni]MBM6550039.1 hypothetical protein [Marinomonas ostreistagni]